jgi:hypothetical protein
MPRKKGRPRMTDPGCQAVVEDYENPSYRASMQRITVPGSKPCSRKGVEQVKHLLFCKAHARLAREGFIDQAGQVMCRNDIREYRNKIAAKPKLNSPPHLWALTFDELYARNREVLGFEVKIALRRAVETLLGRGVTMSPGLTPGVYELDLGDRKLEGTLSDLLGEARLIWA